MSLDELKRITRIVAQIGLFMVSCQPQAIAAESSIYGKVTNLRGQPIPNVVVQFYKLLPEIEGGGEKLVASLSDSESEGTKHEAPSRRRLR